jgi:hypothetical protein
VIVVDSQGLCVCQSSMLWRFGVSFVFNGMNVDDGHGGMTLSRMRLAVMAVWYHHKIHTNMPFSLTRNHRRPA